jgi:uncharacterized protein (TIGR02466 family)
MQINSIFSLTVGVASLEGYLALARELFVENKDEFDQAPSQENWVTTLKDYSLGNVNLKEGEKLETIKEAILIKAKEYVGALGYDNTSRFKVSNIWLNEMQNDSSHKSHYHYGASISGCFYVDMPENCGPIKYSHTFLSLDPLNSLNVKGYTPANSGDWTMLPREGDVFFWKSTLHHEVPHAKFEGVRRCIAFDIHIE